MQDAAKYWQDICYAKDGIKEMREKGTSLALIEKPVQQKEYEGISASNRQGKTHQGIV